MKNGMKKILVINNGTAGLFGFRREVLESLCKQFLVIVLAKDTGNLGDLKSMGCKYIASDIEYHGTNLLKEIALISFYKKIISRVKPDVVLTYTIKPNIYGGIACSKMRIPYIANITGLGTAVENEGIMQKITVPLYRLGLRKAQKVFFQNAHNLEFMRKRKMISGAYELLPGSGVNLDRFQLLEYPKRDTIDFTFISRVMKEKGIDQYLDAARAICKKYPNAVFHVYGKCDEQYKDVLSRLDAEGVIRYHGYTADVIAVHKESACTIHPSYYPEGMSNVLLESAASGRPVITTDRAGCREAVDDNVSGYIISQKDSQALIQAIEQFLTLSWEERKRMGLAGRVKVEREFNRKIVVDTYVDTINIILNLPSSTGYIT